MRAETIKQLLEITEEERNLLEGKPLDLLAYNREGIPLMDPGQLMPDGALFGIRKHTRFIDFPRHSHRYVEMIYQVQGHTEHILDGTTPLTLEAGQLILLGRGTEHEIRAAGMEDLAVNFILIPTFFDNAAIGLDSTNALAVFLKANLRTNQLRQSTGYLRYSAGDSCLIQNLLENLILGQQEHIRAEIQQLTLELLLRHLSCLSDTLVLDSRKSREQAVVLGVLSELEQNVRANLSEIAAKQDIELTKLSRMIRAYTGCTFTELLHTARFNRASVLLRDTELSVVDIAAAVGYENTAFFYRKFEERYHCTPADYRLHCREKTQNTIHQLQNPC